MITITKNTTMGEILEKIPQAAPVVMKYFHGGCYQCPSMKLETLEMGAALHGHDVNEIIADLNRVMQEQSGS